MVALPPPSILLIAALSILDLLGAAVIAFGITFFGLALGESDIGALLTGWSVTFFGFVALKLIALIGLLYARRWAVILGAVVFKVPAPPEWLGSMSVATLVFVGATILYL
ncbi:MAG: hypothetical protein ACREUF_06010, partial [Solimonas sp.]